MRATEFITEGLSHPVICVDVQPEYNGGPWPPANSKFVQIMNFVQKQTGPVLFFINAEDQGLVGILFNKYNNSGTKHWVQKVKKARMRMVNTITTNQKVQLIGAVLK